MKASREHARSPRTFGLTVGAALCAIGALAWWRGWSNPALAIGGVGIALIAVGAAAPHALRGLADGWWRLAGWLAWFNSRVILTAIFALVLLPASLLLRLFGKDPLDRRRGRGGWRDYPARYRDPTHYERMY